MADNALSLKNALMAGGKAALWVGTGYAAAEIGGELLTASFDMVDDFASESEAKAGLVRFGAGTGVALVVGYGMWRSGHKEAAKVAVPLMVGGAALSGGKEVARPYIEDAGDWVRELVGNPRGASGGQVPSGATINGASTLGTSPAQRQAATMRVVRGGAEFGESAGDLTIRAGAAADLYAGNRVSSPTNVVQAQMIGQTEIGLATLKNTGRYRS